MKDVVSKDFIHNIIDDDIKNGTFNGKVITRFPPEPNGYLHIGHAKAICLDFGIAEEYNGYCNLRFDDTNPSKEDVEYVESIKEDIRWLGFDWQNRLYFASDYYERMYLLAEELIKKGKAYVCELSQEEIREYRGTLTQAGKPSPWRDRSVEENLDLFRRMKAGEFPEGSKVLRAKIDMSSPNLNMRDPVIYRIMKIFHHRTKDKWCIYPMYDFAHPLSDSFEGITYSLCTLEFEDHRPLYDWFLDTLNLHHPRQIEFARLELTYTVLSKRKLITLVEKKYVEGWDDPRMPTIAGIRRRGYTPSSIREFISRVGIAKSNSLVDISLLEHCIREELNKTAPRRMAVLKPLKLVIVDWPLDKVELLEAENNPEDPSQGKRILEFDGIVYIEEDDFKENPPLKWFRLSPGMEVRLKHAYYVKCVEVIKDNTGKITEIHCTHDPSSRGGMTEDGRKVLGTLHWVRAKTAVNAEIRLYEHLFSVPQPDNVSEEKDFLSNLNPNSLTVLKDALVEPSLSCAKPFDRFQFLRHGYFVCDKDSSSDRLVFNRIVSLKDSWKKIEKKISG